MSLLKNWIIPCNITKYDVINAFENLNKINWKQSTNINLGDKVYIYVGAPIQAIKFETLVTKVNLPNVEIDDSEYEIDNEVYTDYGRYMELQLVKKFHDNLFPLKKLKENDLRSVQGPTRASKDLVSFLEMMRENDYHNLNINSEEYKIIAAEYSPFLNEFRSYLVNTSPKGSGRPESYIRHLVRLIYKYHRLLKDKDVYSSDFLELLEKAVYDENVKEFNKYTNNFYTATLKNYRIFLEGIAQESLSHAIEAEADLLSEEKNTEDLQLKIATKAIPKLSKVLLKGIKVYSRNPNETLAAKQRSDWKCEIDNDHETFISATNNKPYVEAHHLVPMEFQDSFEKSLDIASNIVALCPNCHNKIHKATAAEKKELIVKLFEERKEGLKKFEIDVELKKLLSYYRINE